MPYVVGPKGQVVIAKEIRDSLGVLPGWTVIQRLAGDHAVLHFIPPEHDRSLRGSLAHFARKRRPGRRSAGSEDTAWEDSIRKEWDA
jgi:hypothetical protein